MGARTAVASTAHRVRLTAVGWGLITILACVALSACTSNGTGTTSGPTSSVTVLSPSAGASGAESPAPSPSPSPIPTEAPVTGGGGTAGFQDAGLAVLGGAAIAAGLASIAYRRWITRNR